MIVLKYGNKQSITASKKIFLCMNSPSVQGQHFFFHALNDRSWFFTREITTLHKQTLVYFFFS